MRGPAAPPQQPLHAALVDLGADPDPGGLGPYPLEADPELPAPRPFSTTLAVLPSSEENLARGVFQNFDWWAENGAKTGEKFNAWLLS